MSKCSEKIKMFRLEHGYTQEEMAKGIGISRRQYIKYENGQLDPKLKTLEKISSVLEIKITDLL